MRYKPSAVDDPPARLTPTEFCILLAIGKSDRHGYAIIQQIESDSCGRIRLRPGTLYGALKRMVKVGYIQEMPSCVEPKFDDDRRRYYQATGVGRTLAAMEAALLDDLLVRARMRGVLQEVPRKPYRSLAGER